VGFALSPRKSPPLDDLSVARVMEEMAAAVCCGSVACACDNDAIPKQRTSAIKHGSDSQRGKLTGDRCSGGVDMRPLEANRKLASDLAVIFMFIVSSILDERLISGCCAVRWPI
jgi:hypothetical protein